MQTDIGAAPDVVWSLISDVTRMGEWSPEATGAIWKGDATGPALGAKFTGTNANGKKSWKTDCEITACEPGRAFGFRVTAGPLKIADWDYRIEPTDTGCHVTETWTDDRGGFAKFAGTVRERRRRARRPQPHATWSRRSPRSKTAAESA